MQIQNGDKIIDGRNRLHLVRYVSHEFRLVITWSNFVFKIKDIKKVTEG